MALRGPPLHGGGRITLRLLRLFGMIFSISLRRELAFRADLMFQVLMTVISLASGLAALSLVYTQTDTLGGWNLAEAIVLLGTYQIVSGILSAFIEPNVSWFSGQVKSGKLDEVLLKPVSSIFLVSLGSCAPLALGQVGMGMVVLGIGLEQLGAVPSLWGVVSWLALLAVGIAITWAWRVLVASLALWSPGVELDVVYGALWQFGRYPVSLYRQPLRFVLTWVLPVAFVSTFPTLALTRGVSLVLIVGGLCIGLMAIMLVRGIWNAGLRRYTSATS
jgi:ABC-2 type transport system permease protein